MSSEVPSEAARTASLVIIGDEILSGKVVDENTPYLLNRLRRAGRKVLGVAVVPDGVEVIAKAVREAAEVADIVLSAGGIGPTHDDVTMAGIAAAFSVRLVEHPVLRKLIERHWRGPVTPAALRMALVPAGADLMSQEGIRFPQVRKENVYIFPGVPSLLQRRFRLLEPLIRGERPCCIAIYTQQRESDLAEHLEAIVAAWPMVAIGSYPHWDAPDHRVLLTIEAARRESVDAALGELLARLDDDLLVRVDHDHRPEDRFP